MKSVKANSRNVKRNKAQKNKAVEIYWPSAVKALLAANWHAAGVVRRAGVAGAAILDDARFLQALVAQSLLLFLCFQVQFFFLFQRASVFALFHCLRVRKRSSKTRKTDALITHTLECRVKKKKTELNYVENIFFSFQYDDWTFHSISLNFIMCQRFTGDFRNLKIIVTGLRNNGNSNDPRDSIQSEVKGQFKASRCSTKR